MVSCGAERAETASYVGAPAEEKAFSRTSLLANVDVLLALSIKVDAHSCCWQEAIVFLQNSLSLRRPRRVPLG
ncbi:MAG: hypothetical protein AW10_01425 [Candidatus Accumulibacter appositus]|uniref:Uncharacterized protein n=1 Tax=Candidatus Accumulibacter appositus TaxID=1454003 RepID=A0A011PUT1_9PROT|nr:MAG: hypothetical protein AW10_01425 [Candidatus Accumulibacter appositus]